MLHPASLFPASDQSKMDGFCSAQYQDQSSNNNASRKALSLVSYHPPIEMQIGTHEYIAELSAVNNINNIAQTII